MYDRQLNILLVEDDKDDYILVRDLLGEIEGERFHLEWASSYEAGMEAARRQGHDVYLVDYRLGARNGLEFLREASEKGCQAPMILLTGQGGREIDVEAMRAGAADYLTKGQLDSALLERSIRYAVEQARMMRELEEANRRLKEAQTHTVQSEKMASLGQLVAGVAHEINNPLSFILSNVFTVEKGLDQIAPEAAPHLSEPSLRRLAKVRARLGDMQTGLEQVKDLVLKLRTFSRLDEGEFKVADVHEGIDSVLLFLKHKIDGRIQVEKQYGPVGALACFAGQLNQVLMNVISNAVDAIEGEGKITIATGQEDGMFFISVKDTGGGIPEAIRGRIFEPFFTTKPVGQGTGLGLAISYGIVQAHRGSIEVRSKEGEGTEFIIQIPNNLENRPNPPAPFPAREGGASSSLPSPFGGGDGGGV